MPSHSVHRLTYGGEAAATVLQSYCSLDKGVACAQHPQLPTHMHAHGMSASAKVPGIKVKKVKMGDNCMGSQKKKTRYGT